MQTIRDTVGKPNQHFLIVYIYRLHTSGQGTRGKQSQLRTCYRLHVLYPVCRPPRGLFPHVPSFHAVSATYASSNTGTIYNTQTNEHNSATVNAALLSLGRNGNLVILAAICQHAQRTQMGDKLNSAPRLSPQAATAASALLDIHFTSPLNLCESSGGKEIVLSQGVIWCFDDGGGWSLLTRWPRMWHKCSACDSLHFQWSHCALFLGVLCPPKRHLII